MADNWNKMKNMASKVIGEKMKVREERCCAIVASAKIGHVVWPEATK